MSTGDTRTIVVGDGFIDTFPVFDFDGFTKVPALDPDTFVPTFRFNGAVISPTPSYVIDEPDDDGEYRLTVAAGEFDQVGFYQVEVLVPTPYNQIWAVGIQAIESMADIIHGLFAGTEAVRIDVDDQLSASLGDVIVQIFNSDMTQLIQSGRTNQSTGFLDTSLDPGTYKVILAKGAVQFANPYTIVVVDATTLQTFTLAGTLLTIGVPSSASLCRVFGYLQTMTGQYSDRPNIVVEGLGTYVVASGITGVDPMAMGVMKDRKTIHPNKSSGIWEVDLVRGARVRIVIEAQGVDKMFMVPDASSANFKDIDPLDPGEFSGGDHRRIPI